MTLASAPVSVAALFGSCLLVPPIAVSLGLAVAAILPHDLEGRWSSSAWWASSWRSAEGRGSTASSP